MKKLFFLLLLGLAAASCSETGYSIIGKAGELNGKAVLEYSTADDQHVSDTTALENGGFRFSGQTGDVVRGTISLLPDDGDAIKAEIILENARIHMTIDPDNMIDYARYGGKVAKGCVITGGANNEFWCGRDAVMAELGKNPAFAEFHSAEQELENMGYADMAAYKAKSAEVRKKFADVIPAYSEAADSVMLEYAMAHTDLETAALLLGLNMGDLTLEELEECFGRFTPEVQECYLAERVRSELQVRRATRPGEQAPDFTLKNLDGEDVTLSSLYGDYLLLDFWASWCAPCRAGVPFLKELYAKYHSKGFEILGIADDNKPEAWKKAVSEDQSPWVHVIDEFPVKNRPSLVGSLYGVHTIPCYILLDKEGKIIGRMDHDELAAKLAELLD